MGIVDDLNAISMPDLQSEMQKAGSMCGTGSFFRDVFNFSAQNLSRSVSGRCFSLSNCCRSCSISLAAAALYLRMLLLPLKASNLRSVRFFRHQRAFVLSLRYRLPEA